MSVRTAKAHPEMLDLLVLVEEQRLEIAQRKLKEFKEQPVDMNRPLWTVEQEIWLNHQVEKVKHRLEDVREAVEALRTEFDPTIHKRTPFDKMQRRAAKFLGV